MSNFNGDFNIIVSAPLIGLGKMSSLLSQFYMTFIEVDTEFKILHASHKKALNNIR